MIKIIRYYLVPLLGLGYADSYGQDSTLTDTIAKTVIEATPPLPEQITPSYFEKIIADPYLFYALITIAVGAIVLLALRKAVATESAIEAEDPDNYKFNKLHSLIGPSYSAIKVILPVFIIGYLVYIGAHGTVMEGHLTEWLNLLIRWAHVVAGIMWIGASFYFIFLENHLNRTDGVRDELAGNLWAVHGGGFYYLEKYKVAPKELPKKLHWFKYEAYFTWLTGFLLLSVVYYMNADAYLIDTSVCDISSGTGIMIGIGTLVFGWIIYDLMCRSKLIDKPKLFALVGFIFYIGLAYFLTHVFNSRAAFIHVGALIGTIMVGNVFFGIIPAQKELVGAALKGQPLNPALGKKAGLRSLHNNYLTLPVIFIMISNHFPSTFGSDFNWLILTGITLASAGVKHYWNLIERGEKSRYILAFSILAIISLALVTSPMFEESIETAIPVEFSEVQQIINARCVTCHSSYPTDDVLKVAPNGVMFDTPEQIRSMAPKIMTRAVHTKTMPQNNKTNMTLEERKVLKIWIIQGAHID